MEGWIIIIIVAVLLFAGFIIYDKRKFIMDKIKQRTPKAHKEKPQKEPKTKTSKDKEKSPDNQTKLESVDYDTMVVEENVEYGKEPDSFDNYTQNNYENIFSVPETKNEHEEDIDIDKLFEELKKQDEENSRKYKSDKLSQIYETPNFDKMSIDDMDDFLQKSFSFDDLSSNNKNYVEDFGYRSNLSGKELGKMIKNLPPEIKALIITDILKPKF